MTRDPVIQDLMAKKSYKLNDQLYSAAVVSKRNITGSPGEDPYQHAYPPQMVLKQKGLTQQSIQNQKMMYLDYGLCPETYTLTGTNFIKRKKAMSNKFILRNRVSGNIKETIPMKHLRLFHPK
jgi:hypothetical protein